MLFRFRIPCDVYLVASDPDGLAMSARFAHRTYGVSLSFPGGEVVELEGQPTRSRFVRKAEGLELTLDDTDLGPRDVALSDLVQANRHSDLLRLLENLGTTVCRAIRNYAAVPELPERIVWEAAGAKETEEHLRRLSPHISGGDGSWAAILPDTTDSLLASMLGFLATRDIHFTESSQIEAQGWPQVLEALEDGKDPTPEQEFVTNAMGHLRRRNLRLALLEAIICLEIVLTQFLKAHLTILTGVPESRAKKFLTPEVGLTARLSALLNMTLHESYLKGVELEKVMKAVEWRNTIIHKTGRLPVGITDATLEEGIKAVLALALMLAERRDHIRAWPELSKIRDLIAEKAKIFPPSIWLLRNHFVRMEIQFMPSVEALDYPLTCEALSREAVTLLKQRDTRFNQEIHLYIDFKVIGEGTVGWYYGGSFKPNAPDAHNRTLADAARAAENL